MGFAPLAARIGVQRTSLPARTAGRKKTRKTSQYKPRNATAVQFFLETKGLRQRKEMRRATGLFPWCVAVPRNESRQFRPAGTRVALPSTNRRSSVARLYLEPAKKNERERLAEPFQGPAFFARRKHNLARKLFASAEVVQRLKSFAALGIR
jgi:hypothetical protein